MKNFDSSQNISSMFLRYKFVTTLDVMIDEWEGQKHNVKLTFCIVTWVWTAPQSLKIAVPRKIQGGWQFFFLKGGLGAQGGRKILLYRERLSLQGRARKSRGLKPRRKLCTMSLAAILIIWDRNGLDIKGSFKKYVTHLGRRMLTSVKQRRGCQGKMSHLSKNHIIKFPIILTLYQYLQYLRYFLGIIQVNHKIWTMFTYIQVDNVKIIQTFSSYHLLILSPSRVLHMGRRSKILIFVSNIILIRPMIE